MCAIIAIIRSIGGVKPGGVNVLPLPYGGGGGVKPLPYVGVKPGGVKPLPYGGGGGGTTGAGAAGAGTAGAGAYAKRCGLWTSMTFSAVSSFSVAPKSL